MRRLLLLGALVAVVLTACGGASKPKAAPDLLYVSTTDGDYAVFGADADGRHARRLTKEKGDPSTPAGLFFQVQPDWSPNARQIAFASRRDGKEHIYVMGADGTGTHRLTAQSFDDDHPTWSPDGRRIVFGREGALFEVPASGGTPTRVGKGIGDAADPAYSPDGTMIAYDYRRPGYSIREVYVMRADGTGIRRVTDLRGVSGLPAWSPDGTQLAFQSDVHGGHVEIYTVRLDGTGVKRMTASATDAIEPAWSPDGKLIAFSRDGAIETVDLAGRVTRLTDGKDNDSRPAWRPLRNDQAKAK